LCLSSFRLHYQNHYFSEIVAFLFQSKKSKRATKYGPKFSDPNPYSARANTWRKRPPHQITPTKILALTSHRRSINDSFALFAAMRVAHGSVAHERRSMKAGARRTGVSPTEYFLIGSGDVEPQLIA
jgi:hypothetical protein